MNTIKTTILCVASMLVIACNQGGNKQASQSEVSSEQLEIFIDDDYKFGYVNTKGEIVIKCEYQYAKPFSQGYAIVQKDDLWGTIDRTGKEVVPFKYRSISDFVDGYAIAQAGYTVCFDDGSGEDNETYPYGVISTNGEVVVDFSYDQIEGPSEGYVACRTPDYGWWFRALGDSKPIPTDHVYEAGYTIGEYQGCTGLRAFSEGMAAFSWRKWEDDWVDDSGYRPVWRPKWGFLNKEGIDVVPCIYDKVGDFHEGYAWVMKRNYWGEQEFSYIDQYGSKLDIRCEGVYNPRITEVSDFENGYATVCLRGEYEIYQIDKNGNCTPKN